MNITALAEADIIAGIKQDTEIQLSVLKDLVKDKNRKIRFLKTVNIIISILLAIAVVFSAMTLNLNARQNTVEEEKTVREMREVIKIAVAVPERKDSRQYIRSRDVSDNKKDK